MTQALPRPYLPSRLRDERRQFVRRARARIFRGRNHAAAVLAVAAVTVLGVVAFPSRDTLVVSESGARLYHTVFPGELAALPGLAQPNQRTRVFETAGLSGIGIQAPRSVTITVDGRDLSLMTTASTVGGALAEAGVALGPRDRVRLNGVVASPAAPLAGFRIADSSAAAAHSPAPVVTVERARRLVVYIDALRLEVQSPAATVEELIADLGLVVREADLVEPALATRLDAGMAVRLAPARTINVVLDGRPHALYTRAATAGEVLALLDLGDAQVIDLSHAPGDYLAAGATLVVATLRTAREEVAEPLPPPVLVEEDPALPKGQVRLTPGQPGEIRVVYEATYRNGILERREAVARTVTRSPVPARQVVGTLETGGSGNILASPEYTGPYRKKVTVWATWYNASHGPWSREHPAYGRTATGAIVDRGICAVDPDYIPLGTRFVVPGYGLCVAADVGGGIKGWKIDLGFPESAGPNPWRTGNVDIYILD